MTDVITKLKHPAVTEARRRLGQLGRNEPTAFVADGHNLVSQALDARALIDALFFLDPVEGAEADLLRAAAESAVQCHIVSKGIFFRTLGLGYETSVRVLAVVSRPPFGDPVELVGGDGCLLVGERIQDPRNVGVMIRTADAWGLACCVFSRDSADPFSRASVRSTTGSVFRVPLSLSDRLAEDLERLKARSVRVVGTSAHAGKPCWEADLTGPIATVLGNESSGLSAETADACDELVAIPMQGGAHSFNVTVAAGIVLYERARQRREPE
jgi:TrmH family RNA methyltransferase